ncbi:MAG: cytochrome c oxidase subunit II [Streptosporangiaceae bacterium]|nr:cytochrome c oxidase subunit II [Streptosporangiaceae bacterium]MBV9856726.1 cytochrome c oxidase subunit II [Streptosporangiaceae bacterium]
MAADAPAPAAPGGGTGRERNDGLWLTVIWLVLSIAGCLVVYFVWGPHLPPGGMSDSAASQQFDNRILGTVATPVVIGVLLYFGWALAFWRQKPGDETDAAPIHGNTRIAATWITVTAAIVLGLAVFGTYELIAPAGAGGGEGPQPIWKPNSSTILQVQVIGQQWAFTYRYPQFGGFETTQLELPAGQPVAFNVTSLDVIHDFWAIDLGVKADANPGVNNVAYTTPRHTGTFTVRCDELCGLWHGAMFDYGKVVSPAAFQAWARTTETRLASMTAALPPYSLTYDPTQISTLGKVPAELGLTGAGGGYYNPADPEQP